MTQTIGQTRKQSLIEACVNNIVGYLIALLGQIIVYPWFGLTVSLVQNVEIGLVFTVISITRSFIFRRIFNWLQLRKM